MYKNIKEIEVLQLDHTSRCNLLCPQCARASDSGNELNPRLPITDLTLNDYKILLEPFEKEKISLFHCGNFGDVIASPTFDETFEFSLDRVNEIKIATNGSARNIAWWKDLATKGNKKVTVIFAIDGLEDTNHFYRVGSDYKKIMENVNAFIGAGGRARWNFIEFEHNSHQVETARQLAKDLGFINFSHKRSTRFFNKPDKAKSHQIQLMTKKGNQVKDSDKNFIRMENNLTQIKNEFKTFDNYTSNTEISCKFLLSKHIFVDMNLRLWPCCWFGTPEYSSENGRQKQDFKKLWDRYGNDFNNMRLHGWKVLEHEFFQTYLENSWKEPQGNYPRIYTCGKNCGKKIEFSSGYGTNINKQWF